MLYFQKDTRTENEKYLEEQLDRERQWREEEQERWRRERERRRQEIKEDYESSLRTASDWHESLQKQSALCWREEAWFMDVDDDGFFGSNARACDFALEIWPEEAAKVQEEINSLQERIARLQESVRFAVGQRLADHENNTQAGWRSVATTLLDPKEDPESWLHW